MLELKDIDVVFNNNINGNIITSVLQKLNLSVAEGEFVVIVGNNGCGKSTLFNTIAGHIQPKNGHIYIDQMDVTQQTPAQRSSDVALVMQEPGVGTIANMTIEENLSLAYLRGQKRTLRMHNTIKRRQIFKEYLAMLNMNLENKLDQLVGTLSGGQRQALSLIMAIIADYKILLLDEITAALDPKTSDIVMELAAKLVHEQKRTAILITHNMHYALTYGDKTLLMTRDNEFKEYKSEQRQNLTPGELAAAISVV